RPSRRSSPHPGWGSRPTRHPRRAYPAKARRCVTRARRKRDYRCTRAWAGRETRALRGEDADDLPNGVGGPVQHHLLVAVQSEADAPLDPAAAELDGDAHVEPIDSVLALEVGRAGKDALLVEHDRVDHLRGRRARRVPRRRAEQLDDLTAPLGGPSDHLLDLVLGHELANRS